MAFPLLCWIRLSLHICSQKLTNKSPGQRQTNNHSTILVTRGLLMHGNTSIFGRLSERDSEREKKERIQEITNSHCSPLTELGGANRLQKKRAPDYVDRPWKRWLFIYTCYWQITCAMRMTGNCTSGLPLGRKRFGGKLVKRGRPVLEMCAHALQREREIKRRK